MSVHRGTPRVHIPATALTRSLQRVIREHGDEGEVAVVVVGDREMRRLNRRFRGIDKPTDVLAFPLDSEPAEPDSLPLLGEVYCNHDHARRWQREHGGSLAAELVRLAVHGCLHLLGFDHTTGAEAQAMSAAEERIMAPQESLMAGQGGVLRTRNGIPKARTRQPERRHD